MIYTIFKKQAAFVTIDKNLDHCKARGNDKKKWQKRLYRIMEMKVFRL